MSRLAEITALTAWPVLKAGLLLTIPLSLASFAIGLVIATATALMRLSRMKPLQALAAGYIWIFRGTPLLVQLYIAFYGLSSVGIIISPAAAAIAALSLNVGAYASESIRAAILAIHKGQWEAAFAIGMTKPQALWRIIAPQSLRVCLPPLSNSFISLVKDTSLAANITVVEAFMVAKRYAATYYEPLLLYTIVALVYLLFSTVLTGVQTVLERRLFQRL